jgi:hypothetical protein
MRRWQRNKKPRATLAMQRAKLQKRSGGAGTSRFQQYQKSALG